jgi:hypothetical protein
MPHRIFTACPVNDSGDPDYHTAVGVSVSPTYAQIVQKVIPHAKVERLA